MANYNHTTITVKNPKVLKHIIKTDINKHGQKSPGELDFSGLQGIDNCPYQNTNGQHSLLGVNDGFTEATFSSRNDNMHTVAKALSQKFKKDVITCYYSYEGDWHCEKTAVEYKAGTGRETGKVHHPIIFTEALDIIFDSKTQCEILERVEQYRKIVSKDESLELTIMIDEQKKVVALIGREVIEFKCYLKNGIWREIGFINECKCNEDNVPF